MQDQKASYEEVMSSFVVLGSASVQEQIRLSTLVLAWWLDPLHWHGKANALQNSRGWWGEKLLREKAVALLGNRETRRLVVMQGDYYWLEVTSCCPPHESHHCAVCEGCCVQLSTGDLQQKRNEIDLKRTHTHTLWGDWRDKYVYWGK